MEIIVFCRRLVTPRRALRSCLRLSPHAHPAPEPGPSTRGLDLGAFVHTLGASLPSVCPCLARRGRGSAARPRWGHAGCRGKDEACDVSTGL